jgi:OOP family OmpA-OmpF porin
MKFIFTILIAAILLSSAIYSQTAKTQRYNPFSGTVVFSVEGGTTLTSTDYSGLGVDYLGRLSIEYFFPAWIQSGFGLRVFGNAGFLKGSDSSLEPGEFRTNISTIGAGVIFDLSINDVAFPYLFAGVASLTFNPKGEGGVKLPNNESGAYKTSEANYLGELGVRFPVTDNLSLNLSGGVQISPNDWLDDQAKGVSNDMFFTAIAGISYSFLTEFDSDGDGVVDSKDMCPDTPPGVKVDEFGCPIDSDRDGVPDYLDECPNTPFGAPVDKRGCPLDSDGDGVPDYTDLCPNTPPGVKVDAYGCPVDSDGDGVPDYLDQCPDTPYGVDVDKYGCPLDDDMDGVPDYLDQCPGTPSGVPVDEKGCEIAIVPPAPEVSLDELVLSSETSFEFNSAQLKPAAFPELDKLLEQMKKYPMSRWRIEGHTDNVGSEDGNVKMSKMRAESVLNYFVSRGVPQVRFEIVGVGSKQPVADNATPEGRAINRRVEIKRTDK